MICNVSVRYAWTWRNFFNMKVGNRFQRVWREYPEAGEFRVEPTGAITFNNEDAGVAIRIKFDAPVTWPAPPACCLDYLKQQESSVEPNKEK